MLKRKKGNVFGLIILICSVILIILSITNNIKNKVNYIGSKLKIPSAVGYVNDFAEVISAQNENNLNYYLKELNNKTGAEVAVITLDSLKGNSVEDVALDIGRKWGIGKKGKDNGVVILVAIRDKQMRIEVGYGLEGIIPDGKAGRIRDEYMLPFFRQGEIEKGIIQGSVAVSSVIANAYNVEIPSSFGVSPYEMPVSTSHSSNVGTRKTPSSDLIFFVVFIIIFIILPRRGFLISGYTNYGSGFGGSGSFGGFGGGSFGGGGSSGGW